MRLPHTSPVRSPGNDGWSLGSSDNGHLQALSPSHELRDAPQGPMPHRQAQRPTRALIPAAPCTLDSRHPKRVTPAPPSALLTIALKPPRPPTPTSSSNLQAASHPSKVESRNQEQASKRPRSKRPSARIPAPALALWRQPSTYIVNRHVVRRRPGSGVETAAGPPPTTPAPGPISDQRAEFDFEPMFCRLSSVARRTRSVLPRQQAGVANGRRGEI